MTPVEDCSTVERVGLRTLLASPDLQSAALCATKAVGLSPGGLTAQTPKALRMEMLSEPDAAPIVVDNIDERKVHRHWIINLNGVVQEIRPTPPLHSFWT
jgi:hypothetical protein